MARCELRHQIIGDGIVLSLERGRGLFARQGEVPFSEWADDSHPGIGLLKLLVSNAAARVSDGRVLLPHAQVACLAAAEIQALALPPACPYSVRLEADSRAFSDETFLVKTLWIAPDGSVVHGVRRTGAVVSTAAASFTLREPLFGLVEAVDAVNAVGPASGTGRQHLLDERMVRLGAMTRALAIATGDASAERYLARITISHATGLGVDAGGSADNPTFKPVLYGDVAPPPGAEDNEETAVERQPLLPAAQAAQFSEGEFRRNGAWSHYRLGDGAYVVLDKPVVAALKVVQRVNAADLNTRKRFRHDPNSFLLPEIEAAGGNGDVMCGGTALAPEQEAEFGSRVLGVAEWEGKAFSFKVPVNQQWFPPEDGGGGDLTTVALPGSDQPLVVPRSGVGDVISAVEQAKRDGKDSFEYGGQTFPLENADEVLAVLSSVSGAVKPEKGSGSGTAATRERSKRLVLRVAENEEDLSYLAKLRDPEGRLATDGAAELPGLLHSPDPHQTDAIGWLKACFLSGMPGALLADDMGLGKTFQVLAFLYWLRRNEATDGRPILIVAPSKLLEEWQEQIGDHLPMGAMGRPALAYGPGLRDLTVARGKESELGRATLDIQEMRKRDWVITTYETLRDHQFSFAQIRFRVAIFDEAQKIKSGTSMLNHAAKAQQPDFVILMTGTPVENGILDVWTLLDVAWPGFLGVSGKSFVEEFGKGLDEGRMDALKERLTSHRTWGEGEAARTTPPVMLRRFKSDVLQGLPKKEERRWEQDMPPAQVAAYDALLSSMQQGVIKPLAALQTLRQVCLHPTLRTPSDAADRRQLIEGSARFHVLFRVLREARDNGRGVLVFVDLRKAQDMLQMMIRDEFRLTAAPELINGNTASAAVADIKKRFQEGKGFGVLLLGPRAAGFGLTLTRATEVVHLNRWWNPAVEDQCSDRTHRKGQSRDVTIHLPVARHPRLGDESFDLVLDGLLKFKREQSRRIIVPSTMTDDELSAFFARMTGTAQGEPSVTTDDLDRKDWRAFEVWVTGCFQAAGWQVNETPISGDAGADLICRHTAGGRSAIIQVKHRDRADGVVSEPAVSEVLGTLTRYRNHAWLRDPALAVVTNGTFDLRARTLAAQNRVQLIGRPDITALRGLARQMFSGSARAA